MGQLCDDDCLVILSKNKLTVLKDNKMVLEGTKNKNDDLWDIPIYKTTITESNYKEPKTHSGMYLSQKKPNNVNVIVEKTPQPPKP